MAASPPDLEQLLKDLIQALDAETQARIAIIGGQALSIWASHYLLDELTGEELAYLASDDLDFLGRRPEIEKCAAAWNVSPIYPDASSVSPNSGIIFIDHDLSNNLLTDEHGNPVTVMVDFLPFVHGVPDSELEKGFDKLILDGHALRILTPVLCLKSRLKNLYSLHYATGLIERERIRIGVAARVVRQYILDMLSDPVNRRKALRLVNMLLRMFAESWCVNIAVKYNFVLFDAIPATHTGFGDRFLSGHYLAMRRKIEEKRARLRQRLTNSQS